MSSINFSRVSYPTITQTSPQTSSGPSVAKTISGLPSRYQPIELGPGIVNTPKTTSYYTEGSRRVCFLDFSKDPQKRLADSPRSTPDAQQHMPARPRYTSEEEGWILAFVEANPKKSWQDVTDGFNRAFNQQRTLKGMQIKGYSLFESRAKSGTPKKPTGLRQLRKKDDVETEEDEEEGGEESDEDESYQGKTNASVGQRYSSAQENWLLSWVADNARKGRRKDWVGTATAFAAKFGLERAPMSLNNKWTHLSRQSSIVSTPLRRRRSVQMSEDGEELVYSNTEEDEGREAGNIRYSQERIYGRIDHTELQVCHVRE